MRPAELDGRAHGERAEVRRDLAAVDAADEETESPRSEVGGGERRERGVVAGDLELGLFDFDGPEAVVPGAMEGGGVRVGWDGGEGEEEGRGGWGGGEG